MESRLGRYVVLKHLASGGMADVLLGRADGIEGFERHVVLKRIRPEYARDERFIRMFLDEARVVANLHHQHVVQVHDIGEANGEYFIAMEYIHGEDVRSILSNASKSRAHVPIGHAIAIVSAAAAGLHYAHERRGSDMRSIGIVHRDVSPSNILVGYDGSIKVVDFGIAKASMRRETRSSSLKGKVSYMSPEQCKGGQLDRRSDVYSLGVVLYELCTTSRLFKGDNDYLLMDQIVNGRVSLPQVRRPDLPNELSAIIMKAISPDPERRFFTAEELRVAVDRFAANAGLTTSTSALGAYLRKKFGERPEPWLELEDQESYSFDDLKIPSASVASNSWSEVPNSDEIFRRSSSSIPRPSSQIAVLGDAADSGSLDGQRTPAPRPPTTPQPTGAKLGWDTQPQPRQGRAIPFTKLAMIIAPLLIILGVLIGRLVGTSGSNEVAVLQPAPPTVPSPEPIAPPVASPLPAVTPIPTDNEPSSPAAAAPVRTAAADDSATKARQGASTPPPVKRAAAAAKNVDTQPAKTTASGLKLDMPAPAPPPPPPPSAPPATPVPTPATATPTPPAPQPPVASALPTLPAQPAPPAPPQTVLPTALDANRVAGEKDIMPDERTQADIHRSGVEKIVGSYKVCISTEGTIAAVTQLKSTGFPSYDATIQDTIRGKWRYRPYLVNGKATPVCTAVRFIYLQKQ
jgi:serine/threonine protein kinase